MEQTVLSRYRTVENRYTALIQSIPNNQITIGSPVATKSPKRKPRILYVANGNGLGDSLGGSLKRSIEVSRRLSAKGYEIAFLTTVGGYRTCLREKVDAKMSVVPCSILKRNETSNFDRFLGYLISSFVSLFRLSSMHKFDVVYSDSDFFCDIIPAIYAKVVLKSKWIAMSHHLVRPSHYRYPAMGILLYGTQLISLRTIGLVSDRTFVYDSPSGWNIEKYLTRNGTPSWKVDRVNNGVDTVAIDMIKPQKIPSGAVTIGAVRPGKGLYDLVPVWKIVTALSPPQVLTVVGNIAPENRKYLESAAHAEGLSQRIQIAGPKDHISAIRMVKESRVFVSMSHEEGWGIAICEALAAGVPVVAYDIPTIRHLFGTAAHLVPVGDYATFAHKIIEILAKEQKPDSTLRSTVSRYSWDSVAEQDLQHMIEALGEASRSG